MAILSKRVDPVRFWNGAFEPDSPRGSSDKSICAMRHLPTQPDTSHTYTHGPGHTTDFRTAVWTHTHQQEHSQHWLTWRAKSRETHARTHAHKTCSIADADLHILQIKMYLFTFMSFQMHVIPFPQLETKEKPFKLQLSYLTLMYRYTTTCLHRTKKQQRFITFCIVKSSSQKKKVI